MKTAFINILCFLLRWSGLVWLVREIYARRKITIINYHNPKADIFAAHARYFARHYSFVSIDQVVDALEKGEFAGLPPKPLLITFDDGYAGNALLFPILREYQIPTVIYVVAGVVGTRRHFWFDKLPHQSKDMNEMKNISDGERRQRLRLHYNHWDEKEYKQRMALSDKELKEFVSLGGTLGSHTLFHPLLDRCTAEVGIDECQKSRAILETIAGKPVKHFALPNGNVDEKVQNWIRQAGYRSCRTTKPGWAVRDTAPCNLPVFGISDSAGTDKAAIQACGVWNMIRSCLRYLGIE